MISAANSALAGLVSKHAQKDDYDVVIVGAGVIGCAMARELSRYDLRVLVLEASLDIANGATRANSGIVHAGFDPKPGTAKAAYNVRGAKMFPQLAEELHFMYQPNGALVLAFDQADMATLEELQGRGIQNGASETRIIGADELRQMEPNVSPEAIGALHAPGSAICDPYGFAHALAENAQANGVEFVFGSAVTSLAKESDGFAVTTAQGQVIHANAVVNAAGINADVVNNWLSETKLTIAPKKGEYILYDGAVKAFVATVFQTPTAAGKGVLIGRTTFGNVFVGPTAAPQESRTDVATTREGLGELLEKGKRSWSGVSDQFVTSTFAGLRATNADTGDFVVGEASDVPGFFNAACIDSPGLASAPAIAQDLAEAIAAKLDAKENAAFDPHRAPLLLLAFCPEEVRNAMIASDEAFTRPCCQCYHVSEGEVAALLSRPFPTATLDALKMRLGCTMGPCQGSRCMAAVVNLIMARRGVAAAEDEAAVEGGAAAEGGVAVEGGAAVEAVAEVHQYRAENAVLFPSEAPMGTLSDEARQALAEIPEGEFEKPRAGYLIPGTRCAGILSARGCMELMDATGVAPGTKAVIWGETPLAKVCATELQSAGVEVVAQLRSETPLDLIEGEGRIQAVVAGEARYECDLLVISADMMKA